MLAMVPPLTDQGLARLAGSGGCARQGHADRAGELAPDGEGRHRNNLDRCPGVRRIDDVPAAHVDRDVVDESFSTRSGEEEQVTRLKLGKRDRDAGVLLVGRVAG